MALSQKQFNILALSGITFAAGALFMPHLMTRELPATKIAPIVLKSSNLKSPSADVEFDEQQQKEWSALFDPDSTTNQKALALAAEKTFSQSPTAENAKKLKSYLTELYERYKLKNMHETCVSLINRIVELDRTIGYDEYWRDKNEQTLAFLRAGQDDSARDSIDNILKNVPNKVSAQKRLNEVLHYYLKADRPDDALTLLYKLVRYDKEHEWPAYPGYKSFVRLAEEFEEKLLPAKAQEVYDLGLNVEVHRNQPWGQAQIMSSFADFQERRGLKEQAETLRRDAKAIENKVIKRNRLTEHQN